MYISAGVSAHFSQASARAKKRSASSHISGLLILTSAAATRPISVEPEVDHGDAIPGWPECLPIQWMSRHDQAADVAAGPALDPRATMAIEWSAPVLRLFGRVFRDQLLLEMVRHRLGHGGAEASLQTVPEQDVEDVTQLRPLFFQLLDVHLPRVLKSQAE
jgi:hypothetical protein